MMPHATDATFKLLSVTPLAPTFGAEISNVDFSRPVNDDEFQEIKKAIAKVCLVPCSWIHPNQ